MKKKTMNIIIDPKQVGVRIPKEFVDEHKITKKDSVEWESKDGKLKGELKKNE